MFHSKCIVSLNVFYFVSKLNFFKNSFVAKKRSDKYLEESRKSQRKEKKAEKSKKSKKKSKKNKPDLQSDTDSDEPKPLHVVNTTIEMPEGASFSDNDEKNDLAENDPHRALDINLDVDDNFYAPAKPTKSKIISEPEPANSKEKTHRKKKDAEPVLMESEEVRKKEKKKHKRKKEEPEVNLLQSEDVATTKKEKKSKKKSKDGEEKPKKHKKSSKKGEYEEAFEQVM